MVKKAKEKPKISPVRKQYLDIKADHPNSILFFRLGDFYETFDGDAEIVSRELDIVLTSRNVSKGNRVPMAGIPHHAMGNYLSRLIDKGHHVAICDQVGTEPINGLMPRKVVRIITPGTIVEPSLLPGDSNNYLASVVIEEDRAGIAYVDITTGEFAATQIQNDNILSAVRAELNRLNSAEILFPEDLNLDHGEYTPLSGFRTPWPTWRFEPGRCEDAILRQFEVSSVLGFGFQSMSLSVRAAGSILQYLKETQASSLNLLIGLSSYSLDDFMALDANTRRNLELTQTIRGGALKGSLLGVLDRTITAMGARLLRQWVSKPLLDVGAVNLRLDGVTHFYEDGLRRAEIRQLLKPLGDLERLTNRVVGESALPRDLVSIRETLFRLPALISLLPQKEKSLKNLLKNLKPCAKELDLLQESLTEDPPATLQKIGVFNPGYSKELDSVLEASKFAREWIANLEAIEQERTGIRVLKVGYNKIYGYYIEVTKANVELVPENYIRKQTLVNAERYITPEMKEYESQVLSAEDQIREIEIRLFRELLKKLAISAEKILKTARSIAELDVLVSLAEVAALEAYVRPEVLVEDSLEIIDSRHPVVEHSLASGERFVPNDAIFKDTERIRLITGPNMSGKSTYLRQVALLALMAQMGSYVPAKSAKIGLIDRIFTRIGAQDEIHAGQSTFMVEMVEVANILNNATTRSLLILDEVGRGTSTYDGVSIAWAVVEYLHNHPELRSKTLFATHYHELTQLSELLPGVHNYNVAVSEADGKVVFLHKIIEGGADRSYGIHVGQLAGLPRPVVQRAQEILKQLEATSGNAVNLDPQAAKQVALFPETNPLLEELEDIDVNELSPMDALNKLYAWQKKYLKDKND